MTDEENKNGETKKMKKIENKIEEKKKEKENGVNHGS